MFPARIVEAVDVFEEGDFDLTAGLPVARFTQNLKKPKRLGLLWQFSHAENGLITPYFIEVPGWSYSSRRGDEGRSPTANDRGLLVTFGFL